MEHAVQLFSRWRYNKHPERKYIIVGIANIAHQHEDHPVTVIYSTLGHPERLWTRTMDAFLQSFTLDDERR